MDYTEILPDLCNLTQEFEPTHPMLWTCFHTKSIEKGENALIQILHANCLLAGSLIQILNAITCCSYYLLTCNCLSQQPQCSSI